MKVLVKVKAIAKRKPVIDTIVIEIPDQISTSNQLIEAIVRQNVRAFNDRTTKADLVGYLTDDEIANQITTGRVEFGNLKNKRQQDEHQAVKNALQCYEDGIFRLLIGEECVEFNQPIQLHENDQLVFIRLTMLAGRMW